MSHACQELQEPEPSRLHEGMLNEHVSFRTKEKPLFQVPLHRSQTRLQTSSVRPREREIRCDASSSFEEGSSLRSRASLLLCRPVQWDDPVTSFGNCMGDRQYANLTFDKQLATATFQNSELHFDAEPLLGKGKHRTARNSSEFDQFVEDHHVDWDASLRYDGRRGNAIYSQSQKESFEKESSQGFVTKPSKHSFPSSQKRLPNEDRECRRHHRVRTVAVLDKCEVDDISVLTDDILFHGPVGQQTLAPSIGTASKGCLGISMPLFLPLTTPDLKSSDSDTTPPATTKHVSSSKNDSPKSVVDDVIEATGIDSGSDRKLLKLQRELNAVLRWTAMKNLGSAVLGESSAKEILADLERVPSSGNSAPRRGQVSCPGKRKGRSTSGRPHRVHFANPAVTSINVRPYTTPEERPLLYFEPEELLHLEEDRASRVPGEQFECVVTPSGKKFNVAVSVPKSSVYPAKSRGNKEIPLTLGEF